MHTRLASLLTLLLGAILLQAEEPPVRTATPPEQKADALPPSQGAPGKDKKADESSGNSGKATMLESVSASPLPIQSAAYMRVVVDNCRTSVPLGSVSMDIKPCVYSDGCYRAPFYAKVSPLFFLSEPGNIEIAFSEDQLRQLLSGERVDFKGAAVRTNGSRYEVSGVATPDSKEHGWEGKLKVRVKVSRRIELIFNTRYHFPKTGS